ncbi:cysteine/O-acetylserine efflux protein [Desulfosporosinus acididurans]|uniref:Cysteine/O-acetylserine efflux protein n=1 Tax=Desulfosporosinus acididurans TaxID=476652 RepID=A0A0J1FQM1_9FIRM|nr:LysE family transporter [Desulfosporosinus acididurans]KLU65794.1 cysteine/O-acetylserine efflux protein [Desulfosporosinus acididurans]
MPNFTAFLSYVVITTFTPGPNNIMSMSNASRYGFKKSIFFNIGIFFGFFTIIALCSTFSVTLFRLLPSIKPIMAFIGAVYILWLAWKTYKSDHHSEGNSDSNDKKKTNTFQAGFLLQFVNPKVILYGITTVSTFIVPYYRSVVVLAIFSAILASVGFIATCCWSLFGSVFQKLLVQNQKIINIVMALLLLYCAISLFLET